MRAGPPCSRTYPDDPDFCPHGGAPPEEVAQGPLSGPAAFQPCRGLEGPPLHHVSLVERESQKDDFPNLQRRYGLRRGKSRRAGVRALRYMLPAFAFCSPHC